MKKIKRLLFLSCLKATGLIEKKIQFGLSRSERIRLRIHISMCSACTNFESQNHLIEGGLFRLNDTRKKEIDLDEFKKSIIKKLDQ